jgi:hypothetical protein
MTDVPDNPQPETPKPGRKSALPSAREKAGGRPAPVPARRSSGRKQRRGRRGHGKHRERPAKPTPARDLSTEEALPPSAEPDVAETEIEIDGARWTVQLLGRSAGGGVRGTAPLLLLGFSPASAGPAPVGREALVVAETLAGLSKDQLEQALARSRPNRSAGGHRGDGGD